MSDPFRLSEARDAASRYGWREAFDLYAAADAAEPLGPDELNQMAECAWWIGKMRHCMALRARGYAAYLKRGNSLRAARVALDLAEHYADLAELADAEAWLQNAARLLDREPEGAVHGWLHFELGILARYEGDLESAVLHAKQAAALGATYGDQDLFALGHAFHGIGLVFTEEPDQGLPMVEEATEGAVAGELGARATGMIYCIMISVNAQLADWQRAGHWAEAARRWCDRQAINGFPGICRVHRAEILRLRGHLSEAEEEAREATTELASFNLMFSALAFRELGEVRLKMGDVDGAEEAFQQAAEMGVTPQPGLAQALVVRGRPEAAATSLRRVLGSKGMGPLDRAKLLPTQLEIAVQLGDLPTARAAVTELAEIASNHHTTALRAGADAGAATVLHAQGDFPAAEVAARRAYELYTEIDLTYEAARVEELLARIHQGLGDTDQALARNAAALATFERIGAVLDARRVREALAPA